MELLSDRYGWTPDEIRAMRLEDVEAYVTILNMKADLEKARAMKHGA